MISTSNVTKKFDDFEALHNVSMTVESGSIFGLVGSNGAGKSTLIRCMTGVYTPDGGSVTIDGVDIAGNPEARSGLIYVPDELYFLPNANMDSMAKLCRNTRARFDDKLYASLAEQFEASRTKPIRTAPSRSAP